MRTMMKWEEVLDSALGSQHDAQELIGHAIRALERDAEHEFGQEVVAGLTFEELVGALCMASYTVANTKMNLEELQRQYDKVAEHIAPRYRTIRKE